MNRKVCVVFYKLISSMRNFEDWVILPTHFPYGIGKQEALEVCRTFICTLFEVKNFNLVWVALSVKKLKHSIKLPTL